MIISLLQGLQQDLTIMVTIALVFTVAIDLTFDVVVSPAVGVALCLS